MSETSDGGKVAANRALKRCPHCDKELETDSRFCNRCGKPQKEDSPDPEVYCINPDCKLKLFTPSAQICHRCHTNQKPADGKTNHEQKTHQQNLETTEQHKAGVKNAVESMRKEGDTQQKSKDTNGQYPLSQGSSPCSSTDAHDIPAEQPQPESRTPPKQPKGIIAATADSKYKEENTGRATLAHPCGSATLPQQSQAPSGSATLPQQSQAPSSSATLPQQSQASSGSATLPQQSQAPSGSATLPQQSQALSGSATLPQQSEAPTRSVPFPQQQQLPTRSAPFPQQQQLPTRSAPFPQQQQIPNRSAPFPQQQQLPNRSAPFPQQQQLPNRSVPFPQQQHSSKVSPLPSKPKSFPPSSTASQPPAELGSSVDNFQVGNDDNHFSTDLAGQQLPIQNSSKPQHRQNDYDQAPDVAKGQRNSEQSSTPNQAIGIPPKTVTDAKLLSQQPGKPPSVSEAITKPDPSGEGTMYLKSRREDDLFSGTKQKKDKKKDKQKDKDTPSTLPVATGVHQCHYDHSQQFMPKMHLKGFQSSVERSIKITFHALVHLPLWDWSSTSCMHIRFGHKDLGDWKYDCGNMTIDRDLRDYGSGWCEMTCTLQIDAAILKNPIPYKYVIYSPKMEHPDDCYEYFHAYSGNPNRCLQIAQSKYQQAYGGTYHQYDTVVYPKNITTSKSFYERAKEKAKTLFWWSSDPQSQEEEDITILSPFEMGKFCLHVYLDGYKQMLCSGSFPQQANIQMIVEEICKIFALLCNPVISYSTPSVQKLDRKFTEVMKEWLEFVVDALRNGAAENTSKQLASALCITHCLPKIGIHNVKVERFALPLVEMLYLTPDLENKECPDYMYLCEILPKNYRSEVATSVAMLCKQTRKGKFHKEWLLALPLYHFLKGFSEPYQKPVMDPTKIIFNQEWEFDLDEFRRKMYDSDQGFIEENFCRFKDHFILDPLLVRVFVYICPKKDLPSLFERIPPVLSTVWLVIMVKYAAAGIFNKNEAKEWVGWVSQIQRLTIKSAKEEETDPQAFVFMVNTAVMLYRSLTYKLKTCTTHCVDVLKASISLVLFAVAQLKAFCPSDEKYQKDEAIEEAFSSLKGILSGWIVDRAVIGGSLFGGSLSAASWKSTSKEELKLWQSLLTLECPPDPQVTEEWYNIARAHIRNRTNEVPDKWKFDLVCLLEEQENLHTILTEALMEVGTIAVDSILSKPTKYAEQDFEKLAATKSAHVGSLLGKLLKRKYANLCPDIEKLTITFDDLLHWPLWPNFIKLYESKSKLKEGLPQECQIACLCAMSKFQDVCDHMQKRSISVIELREIKDNYEPMKRLCEAATTHGGSNESGQLSYNTIDSILSQTMEEFNAFEEHRSHLSYLCSNISAAVQGLPQLKQQLERDYRQEKINTLCVREGQTIRVLCFQSAGFLSDVADKFYLMNQKYASDLFIKRWRAAVNAAVRNSAGTSLTLEDIKPKMWDPAFRNCQYLLQELQDYSMKLARIDDCFKRYESNLKVELMNLFAGVNACLGNEKDGDWIIEVVDRIYEYWQLCNCHEAATAFLNLKKALNLQNGDFSDVEKLAAEVTSSMKDQTLESVDEKLVTTGKSLKDISSDPRKLKCLVCFSQCQEVITWLRNVTNDVNDLQNFVNVALATAAGGEDDYTHDKLSDLRTVGSGFGALIYNLPKDAGYEDLAERCRSLWEALQNSPDLPSKLEHCNQQLEWYKSVKETQGSVEVTSFGKMQNILTYGCYNVGNSKSTQTAHSIHDMVHLKLENTGKQLPKTNFSLDDLRDLESKLVLITGSKAANRREVDQFLNTLHSVCRIAEVLLALQQQGNVKYARWVLSFRCAVDMVDTLQQQAKNMEEELQMWEDEVRKTRKEFYEINYYSTLQLLTLRQELEKLKTSEQPCFHTHINPCVLTLLESISTEITLPCVCEVVMSVTAGQQRREGTSLFTAQENTSAEMLSSSKKSLISPVLQSSQLKQTSLVDDILSSADIHASSSSSHASLQQARLTTGQLTEKQKEMFDDFVNCNYPVRLILLALERFGEERYAAEEWIFENASQSASSDDEGGEIDMEEEMESESDDKPADMFPQATPLQSPIAVSASPTPSKLEGFSTPMMDCSIRIVYKQLVDEFHPIVQELGKAGYSLEQSIEAVEQNDELEEAMDYLLNLEGGDVIQTSTSDEGHQHQQERAVKPVEQSQQESGIRERTLTILWDERAEERYLMLPDLGRVLQGLRMALPAAVNVPRHFPLDFLECGTPNLVVTTPENVLRTALGLYMDGRDVALPLPTHEEVLVCSETTTTEEVTLLWRRAIGDPGFKRIFCLLHAEKLSYQVCHKAIQSLTELSQGQKQSYRLVIICSNENEDKSHIISQLSAYRKHFPILHDIAKFQEYLKTHFTDAKATHQSLTVTQAVVASTVDCENSCVRVVSSTRSGMGKSLFITRMADKLNAGSTHVTIPIHGPEVTPDTVMEFLKDHMEDANSTIFHFDISPTILWKVDTIMFCLLVLQGLSDSQGRVWRCHPTQLYTIEVTIPEQPKQQAGEHVTRDSCTLALLDLLPTVECLSPKQALQLMETERENPFKVVMDRQEFVSSHYQRVYQYLSRHIRKSDLDHFSYSGNMEDNPADCLNIILRSCGLHDPSWAEIHHFVKFLDIQLQSCEASVFCNETFVGDVMAGLKGFVVKFMIRMSRDFATSSLHGEVVREESTELDMVATMDGGDLEQYQIVERRQWEHSSHPYIFFNQDGMSITFVGFIVTRNGDLTDPAHHQKILERGIMTRQLYKGLKANKVNFEEDYQKWQKGTMIEKIATVMGVEFPYDPDESYVLTVDNLIKILAIQMRFRCGIPVVIMGETGCGKTRLIRYMCDLARQGMERNNMLIMKVHGGITESDIIKFIENAEEKAKINKQHKLDTVVFFDEANTTDAIGLIKEIMCDRQLHGRPISRDLKFIAACNPYRKHSEEMIMKLESAGLGFYVRATETHEKLGRIPLRQLVYRVLDLPPSMRPLVYDFGQLTAQTEEDYTKQIVVDHVTKHSILKGQQTIIPAISKVLAWSQGYMRKRKDECSFVSLRDVERAMIVFEYFFDKMEIFELKINERAEKHDLEMEDIEQEPTPWVPFPDPITRSLLLAISVCYHARLQDREDYEEGVSAQFVAPLGLPGGATQFRKEIQCCQEVVLDSMTLGQNIARNAALRENVFMMAICIELRIPLFLVGKPGSSKSLAKSIVQMSMQGTGSSSELLRGFKQVHIFSYQCSQLSTPESVIEVFNTAKRFQKDQDTGKYVSVVVLDEVGLAEDSPNLPLKALHPLLEDGTEGADDKQEFTQREKHVAFIGISNWALDPAKMNRGVMVTRGDPDTRELQLSAQGICSDEENDPVKKRLAPYFKPLAEAYKGICKKQKREFFGLRDFYCLIKMLYWMCKKSGHPPTWLQLKHAISRNFGGMESDELDTLEEFKQYIHLRDTPDLQSIPEELHSIVNPDCSKLGLIKTSLMTKETSWHGENRYLLFLTENYAALEILRHYLNDVVHSSPVSSVATVAPANCDGSEKSLEKMEPFILFGSSFPRDKEYTQVCRNINQIKICMETGRTVILLNLENLYESLYDVLNQYYIKHGGNRYVDLGLQTHRVKCRVHENFKLIVIAEKKTVYDKFPTPLINRLEKHFVLTSSVLTEWQLDVLHHFQDWIHQFSSITGTLEGQTFTEGDAFIGYQKDTPAAVVFQATNQLRREGQSVSIQDWARTDSVGVLGPTAVEEEEKDSHVWKENVLKRSQNLLLQTASPDALIRLKHSPLADQREELLKVYFQQHRGSLEDFLAYHLQTNGTQGESLLMQVTTHSHLLSHEELACVSNALFLDQSHIHAFSLHEFDTELDFSNRVRPAFHRRSGDAHHSLLVIQCDSGHVNGDLIACARYRIYDKRAEALQRNKREGSTHVLFIIHLPRQVVGSPFVGFQGDPWISSHIDDLRPARDSTITLHEAMNVSISQLFFGKMSADKVGWVGEGKTSDIFQQNESEVMQVEAIQESMKQDELSKEERNSQSPLPPALLEHLQIGTPAEGELLNKAPETQEPLKCTPDAGEMPIQQILPLVSTWDNFEGYSDPHTPPPVERSHYTQFRRLHGCIQPAAARLQDSAKNQERATRRVGILVNLIPRNPSFPPDDSTFHGVLVRRIHWLLSERDQIREDDKHWVLNEALSSRKLQNGGTFQNVLARKVDDVLVPIFSEIIALVDRNYNLNCLSHKEKNSPLYQFWLAMFRNPAIMQLHYKDMVTMQGRHREQVPGMGGRMAEEDFKCQLPFSWLVKETVESQWHNAKSTAEGSSRGHLYLQLCDLVSQTAIGEVLASVDETNCEEFYQYYLHDFVRSVHWCLHRHQKSEKLEYKLISDALDSLVHGPEFASFDGHESLIGRIGALHVVYHFARPQVFWFGQLVSHFPGSMTSLENKVPHDDSEMVLHLHVVGHVLGQLDPPLNKKASEDREKAILTPWLNQLRLSQNAIDSILSLPSQSELANQARMKWQLIQTLQMFVEHVVLKHEGMMPYLRRLHMHLRNDPDFLKASTLERVRKHLNTMDNDFKKRLKSEPKKLSSIRRNCRAFFMELVSTLCFGAHMPPEPALIKILINTVFTEQQELELGTRDFSPYHETKSDEVPVIRSFLLQLLLEHNTEQLKAHLEEYFFKSQQALTQGELDQNLCLLCIQCFENALSKEYAVKPSQERVAEILVEGHLALQHHSDHSRSKISLGYIEGVAKARFALSLVAELFHKNVPARLALFHAIREVCTDATINHIDHTGQTDTTGPLLYFLKLIVRQYGFSCLAEVSAAHTWLVPLELRRADEEHHMIDPFVIYNPIYSDLRECVSGAIYGKQLQQLTGSMEDLTLQDAPLLLLALYEKVTLSRACVLPSTQMLPNALEELNKFILECKLLPKELQWMGRLLVANEQGGTLAQLGVCPRQPLKHRTLGAVVVHTVAVFFCQQKVDILQPFVNILKNPAALVNAYLPTMPEDYLPEAKRVLSGKFYECPRGHPYLVGDCGEVVEQTTCNVCGATIGGLVYKLAQDNRDARSNDTTQTGYPLGMPEGRSTVPSPERSLSPAACCLIRALMHSALLWASCNNESAMAGLTQLVKVAVRPRDLPEFFWCHLESDMELLGSVTGKSIDDSAIIVHLVLKEILSRKPPMSEVVTTVTSLATRNARDQWENIFNLNYIQPVLQELETNLTEALHSILNDDKQEYDQLFYLMYERVQVAKESLEPHLWAYRSQITLEHLRQTLQQQNVKKKCPILCEFLQNETNLRATQYLPDIVRLQQCLYDSFHHRLDQKEARRMTIGDFLQSRKHDDIRREYREMVESLQKAWELVGDKLRNHTRLKVDEKYLLASFTLDTPLEYIIPTTLGAGVCTTALTDFLVLTHNDFIETCRAIVIKQTQWREHKIPITHIHGCHLLTYEQHLPSLILSHCRYSLIVGKGQDISYDLPALEKHLLDRFIHGKPFILLGIPQVAYRKDVYTAASFAAVRKKVEPQKPLPPRIQQEILQELRTTDRLRETLDVVDIVLGFLSSGGGKANQPLGEYVHHTLKMKRRTFTETAQGYCTLGYVLSLWETLSVELARQLTLQGQEPFDLDFMPEYFLEELTTHGEENQVEALDRCLRMLDLNKLLGILYEFIETYVKHSPSNEKEWKLVETLEAFLERNNLPEIKDFHDEFPGSITLAQAVAVWKHIVWYQKRLGTHGTVKQ